MFDFNIKEEMKKGDLVLELCSGSKGLYDLYIDYDIQKVVF